MMAEVSTFWTLSSYYCRLVVVVVVAAVVVVVIVSVSYTHLTLPTNREV